jgi:hypothetical protein
MFVTFLVALAISWLFLPQNLKKWIKNYFMYTYPAIISNLEDILERNYDKVCELTL